MEFSEKRDVYADIATLYYLGDLRQEEIAKIYNISRFKVSRVLKKCRAQKIITFKINASENRADVLVDRLKEQLGIETVIIAPSGATEEESKAHVGQAAADYLEKNITDGMNIGISWGSTIQNIPRYFNPSRKIDNVTFVQLCGSICSSSINEQGYMDGSEIIRLLSAKSGGKADCSFFQVPYIVRQPILREMLLREAIISHHVSLFDKLDLVCLGIGSSLPSKSVSYLSGYISLEESKEMVRSGHMADICGIRLAADGSIAHTILDDRVLTITPEPLKKVPMKLAIASGTDKAHSLVAGVRGGLINAAVLDEIAALATLDYLGSQKS